MKTYGYDSECFNISSLPEDIPEHIQNLLNMKMEEDNEADYTASQSAVKVAKRARLDVVSNNVAIRSSSYHSALCSAEPTVQSNADFVSPSRGRGVQSIFAHVNQNFDPVDADLAYGTTYDEPVGANQSQVSTHGTRHASSILAASSPGRASSTAVSRPAPALTPHTVSNNRPATPQSATPPLRSSTSIPSPSTVVPDSRSPTSSLSSASSSSSSSGVVQSTALVVGLPPRRPRTSSGENNGDTNSHCRHNHTNSHCRQ